MLGIRARNALVGIYLYELPFGIVFDVLRVVIHLRLVAGELLIAVCGHSCVSCDPPFLYSHPGKVRQRLMVGGMTVTDRAAVLFIPISSLPVMPAVVPFLSFQASSFLLWSGLSIV